MPDIVDLTGSDDENTNNAQDDITEVRVRRLRRPSDDVVFVSQNQTRRRMRQAFPQGYTDVTVNMGTFDMPILQGRGSRDYVPNDQWLGRPGTYSFVAPPRRPAQRSESPPSSPTQDDWENDFIAQATREFQRSHDHPHHRAYFQAFFPHFDNSVADNAALQRALARSMFETHQHQLIDPEKIDKVQLEPVTEGFTRDLSKETDFLCVRCDKKLGEGKEKAAKIYFRTCGHVYCGTCAHEIKLLRKKRCAVEGCVMKKGQKVTFCQLYF